MKITAVRGLPLRCTCEPISDALSTSRARQALLVLLDTDTGLLPMESEENPNPLKSALTKAPFTADEKMAWYVPQGDGLGIDLDWDAVEKFVVK